MVKIMLWMDQLLPVTRVISRRALALSALGGGLAAASRATAGLHDARAQATPALPRRYVLKGSGLEIVYLPAVRLDYRDATGSHSSSDRDLHEERTAALGWLVTVFHDAMPDAFTRHLTLLVPAVNRNKDSPNVLIHTVAIVTTEFTSIGGPALVKGALQKYEAVALDGMAEF